MEDARAVGSWCPECIEAVRKEILARREYVSSGMGEKYVLLIQLRPKYFS